MSKFREIARMGDQQGIPANLRAARTMLAAKVEEQNRERHERILAYIKGHNGEMAGIVALTVAAGYSKTSTAMTKQRLDEMEEAGLIRREEVVPGLYRYYYLKGPEPKVALDELPDDEPTEPEAEKKPAPKGWTAQSLDERRAKLLRYLRDHSGLPGKALFPGLYEYLGVAPSANASAALTHDLVVLERQRRIRVERKRGRFPVYYYLDVETGKPILNKGGERNGEVTVTHSAEAAPAPEPEPPAEPTVAPLRAEAAPAWVTRLDELMWEFLRAQAEEMRTAQFPNDKMGQTTLTLTAFRDFVTKQDRSNHE